MIDASSPILGPATGTLAAVIDSLEGKPIAASADVLTYLGALFRLAPQVGINPSILAAQSHLETAGWTSERWRVNRNPAGLNVSADDQPDPAALNGTSAAALHVWAILVACGRWLAANQIEIPAEAVVFRERWLAKYRDPNCPAVRTVGDLNTRYVDRHGEPQATWAWDADYDRKLVARHRAIFGGTPMPILMDFDKQIATGRLPGLAKLRARAATVTVHNNGNPASDRHAEARFVANGGGAEGVAYHFAVDPTGATQILPLDQRGVHAGNAEGNAVSIAIEMCEGGDAEDWAATKEQTARLLAMIATHDPRIDWGGGGYDFSLDRVVEHRDWAGANPNCPRRLIATDGGVERVVARARQILAGATPKPPKWAPKHKPPMKDGKPYHHYDENGNLWYAVNGFRRTIVPTAPHEWADVGADLTGPLLPPGKRVKVAYLLVADNGEAWFVGWGGSRMHTANFIAEE